MTKKLALKALRIILFLSLASACKTADTKKINKIDGKSVESAALQLADLHVQLVKEVFTSAKNQDQSRLLEFLSANRGRLADDFNANREKYKAILDNFEEEEIITRTKANELLAQFDQLSDLAETSKTGGAKRLGVKVGAAFGNDPFDKKVREIGSEIYKVVADDLRNKGLVGFLETVFKGVIPDDENGKKMFKTMFEYFDHNITSPNGVAREKIYKQLSVVEDAAISMLTDSNGQRIDFWDAMVAKDAAGVYRLRLDEIAGKGLVRLMEESDPVMTKVIQSFLEEMPLAMQEHVRKLQGEKPPMSPEESAKRFQELDIKLDGKYYTWPNGEADKAKIEELSGGRVFSYVQKDGDPERFFSNVGGASLSDTKFLYLKNAAGEIEPVTVKFIKREEIAKFEHALKFFNAPGRIDPGVKKILDLYIENLPSEFDLNDEIKNMDRIKVKGGYYTQKGVNIGNGRRLDFDVVYQPKGISFNTNTGHVDGAGHAMVMNKAPGKPINKWVKIMRADVHKARKALEKKYLSIEEGEGFEAIKRYSEATDELNGYESAKDKTDSSDPKRAEYDEKIKNAQDKVTNLRKDLDKYFPEAEDLTKAMGQFEYRKATDELNGYERAKDKTKSFDPKRAEYDRKIKNVKNRLTGLGKDLDKYFAPEIVKLQEAMAKLEDLDSVVKGIYKHWVEAAMNEGSFHPDPHQGNIFLDIPKKGGPIKVTYIDVGGTVRVSENVRFGFLNLVTALKFKDYDKALRALKDVCSHRCRHIAGDLRQLDPKGQISELVGSDEAVEVKFAKLLNSTDDSPLFIDKSLGDLQRAAGVMFINANSVHKTTTSVVSSHHSLERSIRNMATVNNDIILSSKFNYRMTKTYVTDALNVYTGKLKPKHLTVPAVLAAAGLGAFFGDEVDVFTLASSYPRSSNSCVIDNGLYSICITYSDLKPSAYDELGRDCVDKKDGLWLADEHTCSGFGKDFYGCNVGLNTVSYAINQAPDTPEYEFVCGRLGDLVRRSKITGK